MGDNTYKFLIGCRVVHYHWIVVLVNESVTFSECLWGFSMPVSCVVKSRKRVSQAAHTTRYTNHFFITFLCIKKSSEGPNSSTMTQQLKREVFPSASDIRRQYHHGIGTVIF